MARILIIRFSALGDVAMTVPVIHSLAVQYPQHEITVLSRSVWQPLFQELPENVSFVGADLTGKHKGFWADPAVKVFLFGGGKKEQEVFDTWIAKYPSIVSMIGKLNMCTELNLMSHLDVMLSMDSANMHLASLVNIPVVSIWGATHPYAGFMGWKQLPINTVQLDLPCRPCSVYGQKPCWRRDYACLKNITPEQVIEKIEAIVG